MDRRLYRSRDKKIGGVCGGIAEFFNIDPTVIRVIWAILAFAYGTGVLAYFIAWLIIPDEQTLR
ncbi:MAG: PspC domain-containing protein [Firmicutes bacterium]|nr:PspC domain-containing protein [Bacillota bacterium]